MSRSRRDGRHHGSHRQTKEYNGKRPNKSGPWPISGRATKTETHREERAQARREIDRQLHEDIDL